MKKQYIFLCTMLLLGFCISCSTIRSNKFFIGTWKIEIASKTIRNGINESPNDSELGFVTFKEGAVIQMEGPYTIVNGSLDYLQGNARRSGMWDYSSKYQQLRIDGAIWTVNKLSNDRIELRSSEQSLYGGVCECYVLLRRTTR